MSSVNNGAIAHFPDWQHRPSEANDMLPRTSLSVKPSHGKKPVKLFPHLSTFLPVTIQSNNYSHMINGSSRSDGKEKKVYTDSKTQLPLLNHDVRTTCRIWRSFFCNSSSTLCDWDNKGPEYSTFSS
jgi:hypothetical protein